MGVNVYLVDRDGNEHPRWDSFGWAGSKALFLAHLPSVETGDGLVRPADLDYWRTWITENMVSNVPLWLSMTDLLEEDPMLSIRFSY